ncbi:MAG TPA: hypothetical protein VKV05_08500 [Terriglobales bacterium]|nr:hypothetical protein [Terriglobales bacterium]
MRRLLLFALIIALATSAFAQSGTQPIGPSAVWQPGKDFLVKARAACDQVSSGSKFSECLINQMPKAGAPPAAVNFTRELYKQTGGEVGIMAGFHKVGPVDIAWVNYLLRSTHGLLLVNGKPRMINVEDLKLLDQKGMERSFQFQALQNQYPRVNLWPGDRNGQTWPNANTGPNGGLHFVIGYPLRNGCPTCAHAGFALFTWNFDPSGRFMGTTFLGMTPPPVAPPDQGAPAQGTATPQ